ncbi:MAG TPA: c-type cytochrome [Chitinophagaceae bacterium]
MQSAKKWLVVLGLGGFVLIGAAFSKKPAGKHKNLQILPQDISEARLDSIMQTYNKALGVDCKFCHVQQKVFPGDMDYASDAEPMKGEARKMMRMTIDLNKTWFYFDKTQKPEYLNVVHCNTCHRGEAFPEH